MALRSIDLMIGDWVRLRYTDYLTGERVVKEFQVGQLRYLSWDGRGETMYVGDDHQNMSTIDKMEPIPLTPEILEKNGFTWDGSGLRSMRFGTPFDDEGVRYNIYVGFKRGTIEVHAAHPILKSERWRKANKVYLEVCGLYVHELQHALRLCGIEKEIEL